jgi:hypothetical protein
MQLLELQRAVARQTRPGLPTEAGFLGFHFARLPDFGWKLFVPYWFLVVIAGISAALCGIPWVKWHFSLRTLLIATTLVAVGLGVIVYASR